MLQRIVFPLELLGFLGFFLLMSWLMPWWPLVGAYFMFFAWYKTRYVNQVPLPRTFAGRLTLFLDDFYVLWIPVMVLTALAMQDLWFLIGLAIHLVLFRNILTTSAREWKGWVWTQRKRFLIGLLPLVLGMLGAVLYYQGGLL